MFFINSLGEKVNNLNLLMHSVFYLDLKNIIPCFLNFDKLSL